MYRQLSLTLLLVASLVALPAPILTADDRKKRADETRGAIKPGPDDPKEKVKPGPIDKDAPKKFTTTKSGLKYRILRKSDQTKPEESHMVEIHYKGWLDDKTIFGSSYRSGKKISFAVDRVIQGWTEGLQLVGKGGMIELEIPPNLGYGKRGLKRGKTTGEVPPNARLHFIIELFDFHQEVKVF